MSQFDFPTINPASHTGTQLSDWLNQWKGAVLSAHSGPTPPSYAAAGMFWVDTSMVVSDGVLQVFQYTGSVWARAYTLHISSGAVTAYGVYPQPAVDTSLTTKKYVDESIAARNAHVVVAANPPPAPTERMLWLNTNLMKLFCWYNDGNSAQWVQVS